MNALGHPKETIALEEEALHRSPQSHLFLLSILAQAYTETQPYDEAIAKYKRILATVPYHPSAYISLAAVYTLLGREEEAKAAAATVLRVAPNFSLETMKRWLIYKDPARSEQALALLRKAGLK